MDQSDEPMSDKNNKNRPRKSVLDAQAVRNYHDMNKLDLLDLLEGLYRRNQGKGKVRDFNEIVAQELELLLIESHLQNRELQESNRLLESSQQQYNDLYDLAPVGLLTLDYKGYIHEVNMTAASLFQTERNWLLKQPLSRWICNDDRSKLTHHLQRCGVSSDQERIICDLKLKYDKENMPVYVQLHSISIMDMKTGINLIRTALIEKPTPLRIREAQESSGDLSTRKLELERLVTSLLHDLLAPLDSARSSAEIQLRMVKNDPSSHILSERIIDQMNRMSQMVHAAYDAVSPDKEKKLNLQLEKYQLGPLISQSVETYSVMYGSRFHFQLDEDVEGFWDSNGIKRAIECLMLNAIQFGCPEEKITVSVKKLSCTAQISIHNYGKPISLEEHAKLVIKSSYLSSVVTDEVSRGRGLSIVESVSKAHGGSVLIRSSKSEGTTFTLELPLDARESYTKYHSET